MQILNLLSHVIKSHVLSFPLCCGGHSDFDSEVVSQSSGTRPLYTPQDTLMVEGVLFLMLPHPLSPHQATSPHNCSAWCY